MPTANFVFTNPPDSVIQLVDDAARRIPNSLIKLVHFVSGGADILQQSSPALNGLDRVLIEFTEFFQLAHKGRGVYLRIVDRHGEFEDVIGAAPVAFLEH